MGTFCSYLWDGVYINRSGEVFACCHQKPKPYGNIHDAPLREVVNSKAAMRLRSDSIHGELSCYPNCNLLDKTHSVPWGHEGVRIDYHSLKKLHISFGEACNIRCKMCDNPQRHAANPILLDPELVIRNVDLSPFTTIMIRGGEPLVIRECLEYIDHLEEVGKRYTVLTNGLAISEERAGRLARFAHSVIVSLNGATKQGHESVNIGSRFERVLENIQRMRRARDLIGSKLIIAGHMTITTSNLHEIPLFLRNFRVLGFDRVNFGYVKETVPLYLAEHPQFAAELKKETTEAIRAMQGIDVDTLRLNLLGLWRPGAVSASTKVVPSIISVSPKMTSTNEGTTGGSSAEIPKFGEPVLLSLKNLDKSTRAVAFIRHSERRRESSPANVALDNVPLTPRGLEIARRFGRELPYFCHLSVSHTSIPRSIQTAAEIDAGFRDENPDFGSILAGKDSMFSVIYRGTVDKQLRDAYRASLRGQAFTQLWLDGDVPLTIMRPAKDIITQFIRNVETRIRSAPAGSLHIHIGHDREIEVVRTIIFGGKLADFPTMEFLDGLIFTESDSGQIQAQWRDRITVLDLPKETFTNEFDNPTSSEMPL